MTMACRNEWKWYHRKCDKTGSSIISAYPPESPYTIYRNDIWWGDSWDAAEYGRAFDFSRPFFDQFAELQRVVPREGTSNFQCENCEYNSHVRYSRNCYLNALATQSEDVYHSYWTVRGKNCIDCALTNDCTLSYYCIDSNNCYACIALRDCSNCSDCSFSYQLTGCKNCILCTNLTNKTYCIRNRQCTKEEFEAAKKQILNGSWKQWLQAYEEYRSAARTCIQRFEHILQCENVTGDHIFNCRNCVDCFEGSNCEDCVHCISLGDSRNVASSYSTWPPSSELVHMSCTTRGGTDVAYCVYCWFSSNIRYCDCCQTCRNCFGCTGLRQKQYCILNKQYTKEEYDAMLPRVIAHMEKTREWREFFPLDSLPHAYNETAAHDRFPLDKSTAQKMGFRWSDHQEEPPIVKRTIAADQLPDSIDDIPDDILEWAITSAGNGRPFRIIKQELDFYRSMRLPVPRFHTMERHQQRMTQRNPLQLWKRPCAKCAKEMQTTYAPDRSETVYCEECYLKEVY